MLRMLVDGDQGDASTSNLSKLCMYCEVNARQTLHQKRNAEKDRRNFTNGGTHKLLQRGRAREEVG